MSDAPGTRQSNLARNRRRRAAARRGAVVAVVVVLTVVAVILWRTSGTTHPTHEAVPTTVPSGRATSTVPSGRATSTVQPVDPGPLATGPGGLLYISDPARQEVLERDGSGHFLVVAGDGTAGYAGDGGPATDAELDDPGGVAVGAGGVLYIADTGNGVVREVQGGTISTVAGDEALVGADWVSDGTPALQAPLEPTDVAVAPGGTLDITTITQVLQLAGGDLTTVLGSADAGQGAPASGAPAVGSSADQPTALTFGGDGTLYVDGSASRTLIAVSPAGTISLPLGTETFAPPGVAGLTSSGDTVLGAQPRRVVRVTGAGEPTLARLGAGPDGLAVSGGTVYVDSTTEIAAITDAGKQVRVLWSAGSGRHAAGSTAR